MRPALLCLLLPLICRAQTAVEIMAKVAENQGRAEAARSSYVYRQDVLVRMLRTNGKLAREEDRQYTVTPGPDGIKREMAHFSGKYGVGGKEFTFSKPGQHYRNTDIDADLVMSLADTFGNGEKSRDGVNEDLFPLTAKKQDGYRFTLAGQENWQGHDVFRITFEPRRGKDSETVWAGEALIDRAELTPVLITTHLAKGVPLLVKTLLGTNIRQIGFKLNYEKIDGLWFPVKYSGEFKVRIVFFYARTISMGLVNSDFRKADVRSRVTFAK